MRPRPSARHQSLGAGNQLWIISAVRELVTEFVLLVGDDEHVIADALGKACNFGLDCEVSGVGAPRTGDKRPRLLLDDPRSELLRGVTYVRGKLPIGIAAADDQQDAGPILGNEILNERIGQHRSAWRQVGDVAGAIPPAQPIAGAGPFENT